jgi:hypothetical protein
MNGDQVSKKKVDDVGESIHNRKLIGLLLFHTTKITILFKLSIFSENKVSEPYPFDSLTASIIFSEALPLPNDC